MFYHPNFLKVRCQPLLLLVPFSAVTASDISPLSPEPSSSAPSQGIKALPPELWGEVGSFLAAPDKASLNSTRRTLARWFQRDLRAAKVWIASIGTNMTLVRYVLQTPELSAQDKRFMQALGIWDPSEDRSAMALRVIMNKSLFNPQSPIDWFGIHSNLYIESFLRQMYELRDKLSEPESNKIGYQLMRSAQHNNYPHIAATILYILKSTSAQSAADLLEQLNTLVNKDRKPNSDIINTLTSKAIEAKDFSQLNFWEISGTIKNLRLSGYNDAAEKLYQASQLKYPSHASVELDLEPSPSESKLILSN